MPDEYERLRRRIEEGLAAADELQRKLEAAERSDRRERKRKLRLIKGGLIWGAVLAGVEWFRSYRRVAGTLAVSGLTVTGAVIAEQPHSPGSDPPQTVQPPAAIKPAVTPPAKPNPSTTPSPRRTSPPRAQAAPTTSRPSTSPPTPKPTETKEPPRPQPKEPEQASAPNTPAATEVTEALPSLVPTPTPAATLVAPATPCAVDVLSIKLCLPLG